MKTLLYSKKFWIIALGIALLACVVLFFAPDIVDAVGANQPSKAGEGLKNPLGENTTISSLLALILKAMVRLGIPIAILFLVYAGFLFVTAQGNETKISKAKTAFMWTVVGIGVLVGAEIMANVIRRTIESIGS